MASLLPHVITAAHAASTGILILAVTMTLWRIVRSAHNRERVLSTFQAYTCLLSLLAVLSVSWSTPDLMEIVLGFALVLPFSVLLLGVAKLNTSRIDHQANKPQS